MFSVSTSSKGQLRAAPKTFSEDLGWRPRRERDVTVFKGFYRVRGLRYHGWIRQTGREKPVFYILRPPIELLRETDFGGCFHHNNDGWWLIGFNPDDTPTDAASGIAAVQRALLTAFETRAKKRRTL